MAAQHGVKIFCETCRKPDSLVGITCEISAWTCWHLCPKTAWSAASPGLNVALEPPPEPKQAPDRCSGGTLLLGPSGRHTAFLGWKGSVGLCVGAVGGLRLLIIASPETVQG